MEEFVILCENNLTIDILNASLLPAFLAGFFLKQPKLRLLDDRFAKLESWRKFKSLYENIYDRS